MLKQIWNSPNSLIGLLFYSTLGGKDCWMEVDNKEYEAKKGSKSNFALTKTLSVRAITIGDYIFYANGCYDDETKRHEQEHVRQYRKLGILFLPAYGLASLISKIKNGSWYHGNVFEKQARKKEAEITKVA